MSLTSQWSDRRYNLDLALGYTDFILNHKKPYVDLEYVYWNDKNIDNSRIDTGITLYENTHWTITFSFRMLELFNYQHLWYSYPTAGSAAKDNEVWVYNTGELAVRLNNKKYTYPTKLVANTDYTLVVDLNGTTLTISVNGVSSTFTGVSASQKTYSLKIGNIRTNDGNTGRLNSYIKHIKFENDTDVLMDLIPVTKLVEDVTYLYDIVQDRYLKPDNVSLIAGPII